MASSNVVPETDIPVSSSTPSAVSLHNRLSLPFPSRISLALVFSSMTGFVLGAANGGQMAGLRFRAENAHRLPTSTVGWYLYHKSKNYNAMLGGVKEGLKMGFKLGAWGGLFFWMEEGIDRLRGLVWREWESIQDKRWLSNGWERSIGLDRLEDEHGFIWVQRDFLSTTAAALGTAGLFSSCNRFAFPTTVRTAKMGLKVGLAFGLAQDGLSLLRGRRVAYIDIMKRQLGFTPTT